MGTVLIQKQKMGEAEAKKRRIFAALGILWATVAAATSTASFVLKGSQISAPITFAWIGFGQSIAAFALSGRETHLNQVVNSTFIGMIFLACHIAVSAPLYVQNDIPIEGVLPSLDVTAMVMAGLGILNGEILCGLTLAYMQCKCNSSLSNDS